MAVPPLWGWFGGLFSQNHCLVESNIIVLCGEVKEPEKSDRAKQASSGDLCLP